MEWESGDVLGCWCTYADTDNDKNMEDKSAMIKIVYALNGVELGTAFTVPTSGNVSGYYPAV